jgi:hypothetical protein
MSPSSPFFYLPDEMNVEIACSTADNNNEKSRKIARSIAYTYFGKPQLSNTPESTGIMTKHTSEEEEDKYVPTL